MNFVKVIENGKDTYYNEFPTRILIDTTTNDLIISYGSITYRIDLDVNPGAREGFLGKKSNPTKVPKRKTS